MHGLIWMFELRSYFSFMFQFLNFRRSDCSVTFCGIDRHVLAVAFLLSSLFSLVHLFESVLGRVYIAAIARSFVLGIAPLAPKPSISFVSKPSSVRISWLCSPISGARLAGTLSTSTRYLQGAHRI